MTRHESRQEAFCLLFEKIFTEATIAEIAENALESREAPLSDYALRLATTTEEHLEEIDKIIESKLKKWKLNRIAKVALSVLRISVCEILYDKSIPVSVSINEAVELAKKYAGEEEASFVNGVLGAVAKDLEEANKAGADNQESVPETKGE